MSIVTMKRLYAITSSTDARSTLRSLSSLGCVEIERYNRQAIDPDGLLFLQDENSDAAAIKLSVGHACQALNSANPKKTSFLPPKATISEQKLFNRGRLERAARVAKEIETLSDAADASLTSISRMESKIASIKPWINLDVPLNFEGTDQTVFICAMLSSFTDLVAIENQLEEEYPASQLTLIGSDEEQHYLTLMLHKSIADDAVSWLKSKGLTPASLNYITFNAEEAIEKLIAEIDEVRHEYQRCIDEIKTYEYMREDLQFAFDAFSLEATRDSMLSSVGRTEKTVLISGWVPEHSIGEVEQVLTINRCAYEFCDPAEDDSPPTAYKTGPFAEPFTAVTNMYGTATYGSIIDPNPLMSIFYVIFFGFMMQDVIYGLLMFFGCFTFLKMRKPSGSMKNMIKVFMYCGVATSLAGLLTGGWLSDAIPSITLKFTGTAYAIPPLWFDPLGDPMKMLIFSLALGGTQMAVGMALSAYRMIKQGNLMDALLDIGTWYLVFIGIGIAASGSTIGLYIAAAGAVIVLCTAGRSKKSILGKFTSGFGALYGVTGYLSDFLSYSRILAIGLSGAVVGLVINKISTMFDGILGIILFVVIFIGGHIFNIAISLLGAYVHSCRLQYIEFFGRFFEDGGRAFRPMANQTKYTEIIKED